MALFGFTSGQLLHGTYRLGDPIGQGGTGVVFSAEHVAEERPVAIKALALEGGKTIDAYDAWVADLEAVGDLDHPHVVHLQDLNELDFDHPYVVMDLVDGKDLTAVVQERGRLSGHEVLGLVKQAAGALNRAHARGLIHGGLRPGNMLLQRTDAGYKIWLTDFGVHRMQRTEVAGVDRPPIGTPPFMAPEQARGAADEQDRTTDVYGLGALAYFALCGEPHMELRYLTRFIARVCREDPPPLSERVPGYPELLDRVLARALAREQAERYPTVGELVLDLAAAVALIKEEPEEKKKRPLFNKKEAAPAAPSQAPAAPVPPEPEPAWPMPPSTDPPAHEERVTAFLEQDEPDTHPERKTEVLVARDDEADDEVPRLAPVGEDDDEEEETLVTPREPHDDEDILRKTAVLDDPAAAESLVETLREGDVKSDDVLRKTAPFPPERQDDAPPMRLRDVGMDTDEIPTVRRAMRGRGWSTDLAATIKELRSDELVPEDPAGEGEDLT